MPVRSLLRWDIGISAANRHSRSRSFLTSSNLALQQLKRIVIDSAIVLGLPSPRLGRRQFRGPKPSRPEQEAVGELFQKWSEDRTASNYNGNAWFSHTPDVCVDEGVGEVCFEVDFDNRDYADYTDDDVSADL